MSSGSSFSGAVLCLLAATTASGPSTFSLDYARAVQLLGQRHLDEAIPVLESVIARAPEFYPAYNELVEAYRLKHALDVGEAYFNALLHDRERSAFAHYALGRIAESRTDWREAAEHFAACVRQMPNSVPCYVPLASTLLNATSQSATVEELASRIPGNREGPYSCLAFTKFFLVQRKIGEGLQAAQRCVSRADTTGQVDFRVAALDLMAGATADAGTGYNQELKYHLEADRLASQLGDPEVAFYHRVNVCDDSVSLDRYAEAQECYERALAAARSQGNRSWAQVTLAQGAAAHRRRGELEQALDQFSEVASLYQEDGDFNMAAGFLLEIGKIHFVRGDLARSRRFCEDALNLALAHGLRGLEAYVLRELSKVHSVSGDPILALRYANESIGIFRELGLHWQAGAGVGNLPEIYAFMGDWPSALRYAQESLQSAKHAEDRLEQQDTLAIIGDVYLGSGQYREALDSFQRSLSLDSLTKSPPFRLSGLMGLGSAYLGLEEYEHAEPRLREALQLARELGNRRAEANALAQLGRCYRQLGSLDRAREYFGNALEMAAAVPLVEVTLIAQRGLAELAMGAGDFHQALERLEAAAKNVESLRARIPTSDLKADFGRENAKLYEDLLYVLAELYRREPGKGWDREAFDYAERGRARAFLDLLVESRAQITKGLSGEQVRQRGQLESALSRAMAALVERDSEANQRAAETAERKLSDWNTAARVTNPQYEALRYPQPLTATQAGALAAAFDGAILEYALGDRESYLWVITPGRIQFFRLPSRDVVEGAAKKYRSLISHSPKGAEFGAWQPQAEALYDMLVRPAQAYLASGRPLVIVPDGILHYLPFETLRAGTRCLIEQFPVSYMPSVSVLAELHRNARDRVRKFDLLAYGDPVFSQTGAKSSPSSDLVRGVYESGGIHFPPLPNTRKEVESIAGLFPDRSTKFLGPDATKASVKRTKLTDYRLLHFATHAIVDDRYPARSGIVFSLVNTGGEDGILRMNEVFNLEMDADLVVLSACQTGLGSLVRGEGMVGLTRAFLYAGARRVAVSLWDVNDLTTSEFMQSLYRGLSRGEAPAAALRSAKIEMLHSDSPVNANPYFWAPFVLEAAPDPIARKN